MAAPTSAEIRAWSQVPFAEKGYPAPTGPDPDSLDLLTERSIEYVNDTTGRDVAEPPAEFKATLREAVQRRVEQLIYGGGEDAAETAGDFDTIKSFGAGSYDETRRDLGEADKAKVVNPWPLLNDLLWRAMTEDKKDDWREKWGATVPAFAVTEVDWEAPDFYDDLADERIAE